MRSIFDENTITPDTHTRAQNQEILKNKIILISRLKFHSIKFVDFFSNSLNIKYIGGLLPYKITLFSIIPIIIYELFTILIRIAQGYRTIIFRFVSVDASLLILLIKKMFKIPKIKVIPYFVGSDLLLLNSEIGPILLKTLHYSDCIFCINYYMKKVLRRILSGQYKSKICVFITPPLISDFPEMAFPPEHVFDVINIGSIDENKNQEILITALSECMGPTNSIIVGKGPLLNFLKEKVQELGVRVEFVGQISHKKIWHFLTRSKMYVHTSKREGLPSSILEAFYVGMPILVINANYIEDLLKYGFKIIIVRERNPIALASAIDYVLQNYEEELIKSRENRGKLIKLMKKEKHSLLDIISII